MGILRPLGPAPRLRRDWAVADFEWRPSDYSLSLLGAYDGSYRAYTSVDDFMRSEVGRHAHIWWHAGGLADSAFIIHYLIERRIPFGLIPIHSAAVFLKVLGTTFHDSYFLLRAPLRDLSIHEEKGKIDYETASVDELIPYNRTDCVILHDAIHEFADIVSDLGGYMRSTVASTAMDLFRRAYQTKEAYLPDRVKNEVRASYFASDVQVNRPRGEGVNVFDITSSFPTAMLQDVPWRYLGRQKRLRGGQLGIGLVTVTMPVTEMYPNLPIRAPNGGIYFPTGEIHGWYTEVDIARASELGAKVTVHEWLAFEPSDDLASYVNSLAPRRVAAKKEGRKFWALALKILLNSLYGKFGERPEKESLVYGEVPEGGIPYLPGIWKVEETKRLSHEQPHVCAWITALARRKLHRQYRALEMAGHPVYYWDCDCVQTTASEVPDMGPELGQWTYEGRFPKSVFYGAPKMYGGLYEDKDGTCFRVKAKGVALFGNLNRENRLTEKERNRLMRENWTRLMAGQQLKYPAMRRFRRILAGMGPGDDVQSKSYRGRFAKRHILPDGSSRPWTSDEIALNMA